MRVVLKFTLFTIFTFMLLGCGGINTKTTSNSLFPADARLADATNENGVKVADMLLSYNLDNNQPSLKLVNSKHKRVQSLLSLELAQLQMVNSKVNRPSRLQRVVDDSGSCSNGGTYYKSGELTKANGGEVEYQYNNCQIGDTVYDGIMRVKATNYDYDLNKFRKIEINYVTDFKTTYYDSSYTIKDGSKITTELLDTNYIKVLSNIVSSSSKGLRGFRDVEFIIDKFTQGTTLYQTKGRIYINNLQDFVEYDSSYDMSQSPLEYDNSGSVVNGEAYYRMRGGYLDILVRDGELSIDII